MRVIVYSCAKSYEPNEKTSLVLAQILDPKENQQNAHRWQRFCEQGGHVGLHEEKLSSSSSFCSSRPSEPISSLSVGLSGIRLWGIESFLMWSYALCSVLFTLSVFDFFPSLFWPLFQTSPTLWPPFILLAALWFSSPSSSSPLPAYPCSAVAFTLSLCFSRSLSRFTFWDLLPELLSVFALLFGCIYPSSYIFLPSSSSSPFSGSFHAPSWLLLQLFQSLTTSSFHLHHPLLPLFFTPSLFLLFSPASQKRFHWPLWITQRFVWFMTVWCVCLFQPLDESWELWVDVSN